MQNKGYVAFILIVAVALLAWAVSIAMGENTVFAALPGGLAVVLGVVAYRVSQAEAFSPKGRTRWEATKPSVQAWLDQKNEADDVAEAARSGTKPRV